LNWLEELAREEHRNLAQYLPLLSSLFLAAGSAAEVKERSEEKLTNFRCMIYFFLVVSVLPLLSTLFVEPSIINV
jgi:hypothetical protein